MDIKLCSYNKEKMGENRTRYTLNNTNKSGEKIVIDLNKCIWGSLQDLWIKKEYIEKNNIKCKYYGFMGMAGDLDLVCIDGIVHRFCIETKELFSKENKNL